MKTTFKFGFVAIIIASVMLSSCGKYDEGPKLSLASKKGRAVNTWKLVKYISNGVEQNISGYTAVFDLKKDNSYTATYTVGGFAVTETGSWDFNSDKSALVTTPVGSSSATTATILRLTSNELWTKETDGSDTDEYHYKTN